MADGADAERGDNAGVDSSALFEDRVVARMGGDGGIAVMFVGEW